MTSSSSARRAAILTAAILASAPSLGRAGGSQLHVYQTTNDFGPGELDHVALTPDGRLTLSPAYEKRGDFDEPVAWSVAVSKDGTAYVGTGHEGRVWRVPASGEPSLLFDADELEVLALAVSPSGRVYAGTSPHGKVYAIEPNGSVSPLFEPEERYIWALKIDHAGKLLVATGDPASVYRIDNQGNAEKLLSAEVTHILSLAIGPDDTIYAGGGGDGYVYRISSRGEPYVLLDTEHTEVQGLLAAPDGSLWVSASGQPGSPGSPPAQSPVPPPAPVGRGGQGSGASALGELVDVLQAGQESGGSTRGKQAPAPIVLPSGGPQATSVLRIMGDGPPELIWRSGGVTVYGLGWSDGQALLATGDDGRILGLDERGRATVLVDLPGGQVTALSPIAAGGGYAAAVSNLAGVYIINGKPAASGMYTSTVIDAASQAKWGHLTLAAHGEVTAETRAGNTERTGAAWSSWLPAGDGIASPPARYLQFRLKLAAGRVAPSVDAVRLSFLPTNRSPRIDEVEVLGPHSEIRFQGPSPFASQGAMRSVLGRSETQPPGGAPPGLPPPPEQEAYGMRSARWQASDADGDAIVYTVEYRGLDEEVFKLMAQDLNDGFISWDETALPDGHYVLRVTASDADSNASGRGLETSLESEPFLADLTPPSVTPDGSVKTTSDTASVSFNVTDTTSNVTDAEFSVDGQGWQLILPEDGVFDERRETISIELTDLSTGEHTVVLRAADEARNVSSGKLVFTLRATGGALSMP